MNSAGESTASPTLGKTFNAQENLDSTWVRFQKMGPGVNFGNMFEAATTNDFELTKKVEKYSQLAWNAGFRNVRIPIRWSSHAASDKSGTIDPDFLSTIDNSVSILLSRGFTVIINMHHYRQLDGDPLEAGDPIVAQEDVLPRFISIWNQISKRFSHNNEKLFFEIYNEPHGSLNSTLWNNLLKSTLDQIRKTNPNRTIVIGPTDWNSAFALDTLNVPNDPNIVVTIHSYEPFNFTHQQARWAGEKLATTKGVLCCSKEQIERMNTPLEKAKKWSLNKNIPIWIGEFGSYKGPQNSPNNETSRINYTKTMRELAEMKNFQWTYWELDSGFGIYSQVDNQWNPNLLNALIPTTAIKQQ